MKNINLYYKCIFLSLFLFLFNTICINTSKYVSISMNMRKVCNNCKEHMKYWEILENCYNLNRRASRYLSTYHQNIMNTFYSSLVLHARNLHYVSAKEVICFYEHAFCELYIFYIQYMHMLHTISYFAFTFLPFPPVKRSIKTLKLITIGM